MSGEFYSRIIRDDANQILIDETLDFFQNQVKQARQEATVQGKLSREEAKLSGQMDHRFGQLQELEAILKHYEIKRNKIYTSHYKQYLEHYQTQLSSRDAGIYAGAESSVIEIDNIINKISFVRNLYIGVIKAFDIKNWQMKNITTLVANGFEDYSID